MEEEKLKDFTFNGQLFSPEMKHHFYDGKHAALVTTEVGFKKRTELDFILNKNQPMEYSFFISFVDRHFFNHRGEFKLFTEENIQQAIVDQAFNP